MTSHALELIQLALDRGIELQQVAGRLKCRIPEALLTDDLQHHLALHKDQLIALLQQHGCHGALAGRASFAQRRMWFVHRLAPRSPLYNEPMMLRLNGALDVHAMQQALDMLMDRHAVLRTLFLELGGELCQVVMPGQTLPLVSTDLQHLAGERAEAEALAEIERQAQLPFDLERGPLVRAQLFRVSGDRHLLGMVWHHICGDHWSMEMLLEELLALYEARRAGRHSPPPAPRLQYADFARWQFEALQ